jgi:hypothetical protein
MISQDEFHYIMKYYAKQVLKGIVICEGMGSRAPETDRHNRRLNVAEEDKEDDGIFCW